MSPEQIESLLRWYSSGETTPAENELVERWLEQISHPESSWSTLDEAGKDQWLADVFQDIQRSIHEGGAPVVAMQPKRSFRWPMVAAAAAIILIFSTLFIRWPAWKVYLQPAELISVRALTHQKKLIVLSDSTRVWVNAASSLKYPATFEGSGKREVWLSGEAYFDVHHEDGHPFIIHTGEVITTVLGTAFNIKEDKQHNTIAVTVTRGKVSVASSGKIIGILTPNEQLTFNTSNNKGNQKTVDAQRIAAWQQSDLHFEDVSFAGAAQQLEQHFGVKISFANERLKTCRFTGTSVQGEDLSKILRVICAFNNATYKKGLDGSFVIDGKGCDQQE